MYVYVHNLVESMSMSEYGSRYAALGNLLTQFVRLPAVVPVIFRGAQWGHQRAAHNPDWLM